MGSVTNETTYVNGSSESIIGYRSGSSGTPSNITNTCDIRVSAEDPFDFNIDWRTRTVKTRKFRKRPGRFKVYYTYVEVPYPYYEFVKKTRSVREWRLELSAGESVLRQLPKDTAYPHIEKKLNYLRKKLTWYGECRPVKPRSAGVQHDVLHWKSEGTSVPVGVKWGLSWAVNLATNGHYNFRAFEFEHEIHVGDQATDGLNVTNNAILENAAVNEPQTDLFSTNTVSTLTAMLWPASGDFEDIGVTPLVDLAEAASDGVFPLGPPPSASDAHKRMVKNCMNDRTMGVLTEIVDFAADSYLWSTLVLEPVIQSAIGLSASVEANDKAISAYAERAKTGKWHQGKSLRIFGKNPQSEAINKGCPEKLETSSGTSVGSTSLIHTFEYDKFEGNASLNYKLSEGSADLMNTSGMRIGQFFNRMSVSLDTVLHNIIPLSFVYDWFSSEYTGILNLKDKVYMPVDDWNLVISYNLRLNVSTDASTTVKETTVERWTCNYTPAVWWGSRLITPESTSCSFNADIVHGGHVDFSVYDDPIWLNANLYYDMRNPQHVSTEELIKGKIERHSYYKRKVYSKPARRTDFSNGEIGIEYLNTTKYDGIEDTGKQVTLAALLWGFIPG